MMNPLKSYCRRLESEDGDLLVQSEKAASSGSNGPIVCPEIEFGQLAREFDQQSPGDGPTISPSVAFSDRPPVAEIRMTPSASGDNDERQTDSGSAEWLRTMASATTEDDALAACRSAITAASQGDARSILNETFAVVQFRYNDDTTAEVRSAAVHAAAVNGWCRVIAWLVESGADVNIASARLSRKDLTPLYWACVANRRDAVSALLDSGAVSVDQRDGSGNTPLTIAAGCGHDDVVRLLVDRGARVDERNDSGRTPVWFAASAGRNSTVELLAERGADINAKNNNEHSPLWIAAQNGRTDTVRLLVDRHAAVNDADRDGVTPLTIATIKGHHETVELLLDGGGADTSIRAVDITFGMTALMIAVGYGHASTALLLCRSAGGVDERDSGGQTALMYAARKCDVGFVEMLIEHRADVNLQDNRGRTALHWAAMDVDESYRGAHVLQILLNRGADRNIVDNDGRSARAVAEEFGRIEATMLLTCCDRFDDRPLTNTGLLALNCARLFANSTAVVLTVLDKYSAGHRLMKQCADPSKIRDLIKQNVDMNTQNYEGNSPLHFCALLNNINVVKALIRDGNAEVNATNVDGRTPLCLAALRGHADVVRVLLENKADANAADGQGQTALHLAASVNKSNSIRVLLDKGKADRNSRDVNGNTPFHCACTSGSLDAVEMLLDEAVLTAKNADGWTPLHCAVGTADSGDGNTVTRILIERMKAFRCRKSVDETDKVGRTALHLAVRRNNVDAVRELRELNPELLNDAGLSPLHLASQMSSVDALAAVLDVFYTHGQYRDVDHASGAGESALLICVGAGDVDKVRRLLQYGANLSRRGHSGITVLHRLAELSNRERSAIAECFGLIQEHAVGWWFRQRKIVQDVPARHTARYDKVMRKAVVELVCDTTYKGMNVLQYAAACEAFSLLGVVANSTGIFVVDRTFDVTYMTHETMPPTTAADAGKANRAAVETVLSFDGRRKSVRCSVVESRAVSSRGVAPRCDDTAVLERVVNSGNGEDATILLATEPFRQLVKPYWRVCQMIYVTMLVVHASHMTLFTAFALPNAGWLDRRFNENISTTSGSNSSEDDVATALQIVDDSANSWLWLLLIWPTVNLALDIVNVVLLWNSTALSEVDAADFEQQQQPGNFRPRCTTANPPYCCCFGSTPSTEKWTRVVQPCLPSLGFSASFVASVAAWYGLLAAGDVRLTYLISVAVVFLVGWTYTINFLSIFASFMTLVGAVKRIFVVDMIRFFFVYCFVLVSFSLAFYTMTLQRSTPVDGVTHRRPVVFTMYAMFCQMLGMETVYDHLSFGDDGGGGQQQQQPADDDDAANLVFVRVMFVVYVSVSAIVLLNLLIAMMSDTYAEAVAQATRAINAYNLRMLGRVMWLERRLPVVVRLIVHGLLSSNRVVRHRRSNDQIRWHIVVPDSV